MWYTNGSYYFAGAGARKTFYYVSGIPHAFFDGYDDVLGGGGSTMFPTYSPIIASHLGDPSPLSMDAVYRWQSATSGTLFVSIDVDQSVPTSDNHVHFVLCEDGEGGNPNLARAVLTEEPFTLTSPGESVEIVRTFTLDPTWDKEAMRYVVLVQTHGGDREVLQSALARPGQGIAVSPDGDLSATGEPGGPYEPTSVDYTVENLGPAAVNYSVTASEPWVTVTEGRGTIPGLGSTTVTVELNMLAQALGSGFHSADILFENTDNHIGDDTREVTVRAGDPALVYSEDFEDNPYWSGQLLWQRGEPLGSGGQNGHPDPLTAHSGTNVYGYNLNGDYENNLDQKNLSSQPFDCSEIRGTTLKFWRWLGVDDPQYDHASIRVSTDFTSWTTVWQNAKAITDSAWTQMEVDISGVADGSSTVYLRWVMGETDASGRYCGWNIDDVEIHGFAEAETGIGPAEEPAVKLAAYPNPFNPRTTIRYTLPEPRRVRLTVHDLTGRMVDVLVDGRASAGTSEAVWDGRTVHGEPVASGVYFCRYDDGVRTESTRVVLLK
ncbi:MAG: T9SS type A sorting domain-containing protein [Candidatus Eisenbacteria bacterium]|nr:T9SS type A sorting domain-containing protein [Candidatus Eisenbacteria bacterium]